jgi:hypothetical protein
MGVPQLVFLGSYYANQSPRLRRFTSIDCQLFGGNSTKSDNANEFSAGGDSVGSVSKGVDRLNSRE